MGNAILFVILAALSIGGAVGMLFSRNAVHSALYLVLNLLSVAVFYLVLNAPFLAMVQVAVYAGAIVVLFLFVIMLLGAESLEGAAGGIGTGRWWIAVILGIVMLAGLSFMAVNDSTTAVSQAPTIDASPQALGLRLFEEFVLPFEIAGILLLAATVGVFSLAQSAKQKRLNELHTRAHVHDEDGDHLSIKGEIPAVASTTVES